MAMEASQGGVFLSGYLVSIKQKNTFYVFLLIFGGNMKPEIGDKLDLQWLAKWILLWTWKVTLEEDLTSVVDISCPLKRVVVISGSSPWTLLRKAPFLGNSALEITITWMYYKDMAHSKYVWFGVRTTLDVFLSPG